MKRIYTLVLWITLGIVSLLWAVGTVVAQGDYDLSWWTIDGGGSSSGGGYQLVGVVGQMDAGVLSDGTFTLSGGFLVPEEVGRSELFMPVIEGEE